MLIGSIVCNLCMTYIELIMLYSPVKRPQASVKEVFEVS